jgi:hypothetical protein
MPCGRKERARSSRIRVEKHCHRRVRQHDKPVCRCRGRAIWRALPTSCWAW